MSGAVGEILFYHLERQPLDAVLPQLVERCVGRGWRTVIQTGSPERTAAIDTLLWSWRDDSFLPHATEADGDAAEQPVFITDKAVNPNAATVRILIDGADIADPDSYDRVVCLFDGRDADNLAAARALWKRLAGAGCNCTYWQQDERGRWESKAESGKPAAGN